MTAVVALTNQKGGVGKTTSAVNLAAYLARGRRVLLLDMDPQANATSSLGVDWRSLERSTYDVVVERRPLREIVVSTSQPSLWLGPAARSLAGAEVELVDAPDRETRLLTALETVAPEYDLVLVDCPPSLGLLTVNALAASSAVLVPVQCEYLALEGLGQLMDTLDLVRERLNPALSLLGILLTMHDPRTNLSTQVVAEVRAHYPTATFETVIPRSVRLSEAPSYGKPMLEYDPSSRGAQAYAALAEEVARRLGGAPGKSTPRKLPEVLDKWLARFKG